MEINNAVSTAKFIYKQMWNVVMILNARIRIWKEAATAGAQLPSIKSMQGNGAHKYRAHAPVATNMFPH
jgi:hypothetical protein